MSAGRRTALVALLGVLGVMLAPRAAWSEYTPNSGPYQVRTIKCLVLHDAARGKNLPLKIYYPAAPGQFPIIIFSHGALASKDCYSALGQYWASFGYVSIHPSHADSIADSGFRGTLQEAISDPRAWENRPKDISFVIDSLPEIERLAPQLKGKLDARHIGVGGHSFGAYTAQLIGGTRIQLPGKDGLQSFADKRVTAILMFSGQGENRMGLSRHSWDTFRLPMLLMYGSRDFGPFGEAPDWRAEAYQKAPPGDKYEVELEGGRHMGFAGPRAGGGIQDEVFQCAKLESLAFWDAYLKKDAQAKRYLSSNALRKFSIDGATFSSK
jgi:dienelactone hydrolase